MYLRALFAFVAIIFTPALAFANAAAPAEYVAGVDVNTVEVCPTANHPMLCGTDDVLLRQNMDTGEVVALDSTNCVSQELACGDGSYCCFNDDDCCFQDPCVEPGTYRYGSSEKIDCSGCAWTNDFIEVVVEDDATECDPTQYDEWTGDIPWESAGNGGEADVGNGGEADAGNGGDADAGSSAGDGESGCHSTVTTVTLINLFAFALGLFLWRRRRTEEAKA